MEDLLHSILSTMSSVKKPQAKALVIILMALAYFQGRANFRNLARFCHLSEDTLRRWSKRAFPYQELNVALLDQEVLQPDHERIAALDASYIYKSGKATEGLGYFHSGASGRVEKGLEMSLLSVIDLKRHTGFSLLARQTQNHEEPGNRIDQAIAQIKDCQKELQALHIKDLAVDAWYSKERFVRGVSELGFHVVGKFRIDARLYFEPKKNTGRGRPRVYGQRLKLTDLRRLSKVEMENESFNLYSGILYSKSLKRNVKVVILRDKSTKKNKAILYSTDLQASAESILKKYRARFQIEFVIRDAKQHTGLEHCQSRSSRVIENHFNNALTALNLLKVEDIKKSQSSSQKVISIASWRRRKTNEHIAKIIFDKLGYSYKTSKIKETIEFIRNYGCIAA